MSIHKRKGSPFYWYEFECAGQRVRGSTRVTNKREARAIELKALEQAKQAASIRGVVTGDVVSLRIEDAALRYFEEVKDKLAGARDVKRDLLRLGGPLGSRAPSGGK
jgi:hypothetical protein